MSDIFFVKNKRNELVRFEFMKDLKGKEFADPDPDQASKIQFYDASGQSVDREIVNPNLYMVAPVGINLDSALELGRALTKFNNFDRVTVAAFEFGYGPSDLQRSYTLKNNQTVVSYFFFSGVIHARIQGGCIILNRL